MSDTEDVRTVASMRWQAVEGFTFKPGLSCSARRLGIALITHMDIRTLECFPGEGGPRQLCRYTLNWEALTAGAKAAIPDAKKDSRKPEPQFVPGIGEPQFGIDVQGRIPVRSRDELQFAKETNPSSSYLSHLSPPNDLLKGDVSPKAPLTGVSASPSQTPTGPPCYYPRLEEAFTGEQDVLKVIRSLPMAMQAMADKARAIQGIEAARKKISELSCRASPSTQEITA